MSFPGVSTTLLMLLLPLAGAQPQTESGPLALSGNVLRYDTGEGIADAELTLCLDTGRTAAGDPGQQLPPRDVVREIRIPDKEDSGLLPSISVSSAILDCRDPVLTDPTGSFFLAGFLPGKYIITIRKEGFIGKLPSGDFQETFRRTLDLSSSETREGMSFSLIESGTITGRVFDAGGQLVSGVTVTARVPGAESTARLSAQARRGFSRQTDDRGNYRLFSLPPGEYAVTVDLPDPTPETNSVAPDQRRSNTDADRSPVVLHVVVEPGQETSRIDFILPIPVEVPTN